MPVGKASWRQFAGGVWLSGPRENCPSGNLRRGSGIYPLRSQGSVLSCSGNVLREADNGDHAVRGLSQFQFDAIVARRTGLTANGLPFPTSWQSGGGVPATNGQRVEFLELPAQFLSTSPNIAADLSGISPNTDFLFVSGAGPALKADASLAGSYWGIDAPAASVVAGLNPQPIAYGSTTSKVIDTFEFDPGGTRVGAGPSGFNFVKDGARKVVGSFSNRLDCPRDAETMMSLDHVLDLTTFTSGAASTDEDYIQFWVHVARPANVTSINVKFFVGAGGTVTAAQFNQDPNVPSTTTAPYQNYYHTELSIQVVKEKRKRQLLGLGDFVPFDPQNRAMKKYLAQHPPDQGPDLDALQFLNPRTIAVSRNTWTLVTIPKGLFDRAGLAGTTGNTWANVLMVQLSVETNKSGNTSVWFDDLNLKGGVGTRGDYLYTITYRNDATGARSNPPYTKATDGTITLATTASVTLDRQGASITGFPAALAAGSFRGGTLGSGAVVDTQVTHIEIWRTIGNGSVGKPSGGQSNALFNAPQSIQMFLVDKIAVGTTSYTDTVSDYPGMFSLQSATFLNSDQEMLFDNQPPWTVNQLIGSPRFTTMGQAIYHVTSGRVWYLDTAFPTRVFCSPPGRPESVASFIEPTTKDDPIQRLVVWNDNLYIFSQRRIFQLNGQDIPFTADPIAGVPGTLYPYTVAATPAGIFYVGIDGARMFDGQASQTVAADALGPLFRGSTSEGYPAWGPTGIDSLFPGNFAVYCRDEVYLTDGINTVWCYSPATDAWRNLPLKNVTTLFQATTDIGNRAAILAGVNDAGANVGTVYYFDGVTNGEQGGIAGEPTTFAMNAADVGNFDLVTPGVFVSGENQGIVMMVYIEADTQGFTIPVNLFLDGTTLALGSITSSGKQRFEFNVNRPANIASVEFVVPLSTLTTRIEISSIEIQVYESAGE